MVVVFVFVVCRVWVCVSSSFLPSSFLSAQSESPAFHSFRKIINFPVSHRERRLNLMLQLLMSIIVPSPQRPLDRLHLIDGRRSLSTTSQLLFFFTIYLLFYWHRNDFIQSTGDPPPPVNPPSLLLITGGCLCSLLHLEDPVLVALLLLLLLLLVGRPLVTRRKFIIHTPPPTPPPIADCLAV